MSDALSSSALRYACQRVEDFALVNVPREGEEKLDAVDLWLDSLGFDETLRAEFYLWIERFVGPGWDGTVMIGLLVGLHINQFNHDNPSL